MVEHKEA